MDSRLRNVRLRPSKICDGVGLFPIDTILKDEVVINYLNHEHPDTFDIANLSTNVKKYLYTLWGITNTIPGDNIFHPVNFLNHSDRPTVRYDKLTGNYLTNRILRSHDEITINYVGYNDPLYNTFKHLLKPKSRNNKLNGARKSRRRVK
jgi:hypothetical protein